MSSSYYLTKALFCVRSLETFLFTFSTEFRPVLVPLEFSRPLSLVLRPFFNRGHQGADRVPPKGSKIEKKKLMFG